MSLNPVYQQRWQAIPDVNLAMYEAGYDAWTNPALLLEYICLNNREDILTQLETSSDIITQRLALAAYVDRRQIEYQKLDALLLEALVEKELGFPEKWDEYLVKRNIIKSLYPKT